MQKRITIGSTGAAAARFLKSTLVDRGPVNRNVTRIPQGIDGCSAGAACWVAFCRCALKLRLALGAAECMLGDGAA